jgi:SAM-dependent methyltransferase
VIVSRVRRLARRYLGRPALVVPDRFNRNSGTVTSLMPPEQSGLWLLERLKERLSLTTLANTTLLDFGCGVRFSQALVNLRIPIGRYVGVDCYAEMIEFLRAEVGDRRFSYHVLDARNPYYNPGGQPLSPATALPVVERDFDVITLFSVITHQYPQDSEAIFTVLRRHVATEGRLFFTCFLDPALDGFEDRSPERNARRCFYGPDYLVSLVERCGWRVVSRAPGEAPLIGDSFLLRPSNPER